MTFVQAMIRLRHWLDEHAIVKDGDKIKITIEASTPEMASRLLHTLKREMGPELLQGLGTPDVDLNRPLRLMGMALEFKLKEPERPRDVVPERVAWPGQAGYEQQKRGR